MKKTPSNQFNMKSSKVSQGKQKQGRRYQSFINSSNTNTYIGFANSNTNLNNNIYLNSINNTPPTTNHSNHPYPLRKRTSEIQTSAQHNYGKQQNIITNLRSQLTNLKQEVAKLMHKDSAQSQVIQYDKQKDKDKDFNTNIITNNYSRSRPPSSSYHNTPNLGQNQSLIINNPKPQSSSSQSKQFINIRKNQQIDPNKKQPFKLLENQKLSLQLKASYARQKQVLRENKRLMQALSKQSTKNQQDKASFNLKNSYLTQIEELKNLQKQLQYQIETKNKTIESQRQRIYSMQAQFYQKLTQANNDNNNKSKEINQLKKALNQQKKKRQLALQDINKAEPDYSQINKLKQKLLTIQTQNQSLLKKIDQKIESNKEKDNQIQYLESVLKTSQLLQKDKNTITQQLKTELYLIKESLKLKEQAIDNLKKQKQALIEKEKSQINCLAKQNQQLSSKLKQSQTKIEQISKNFKQNQQLLLNMNNHSTKKKDDDQKLKNQLKMKEKTINNLINDVKHLQHELRQYHFCKGYCKSMESYIKEINEEKTLVDLCKLNTKYLNK